MKKTNLKVGDCIATTACGVVYLSKIYKIKKAEYNGLRANMVYLDEAGEIEKDVFDKIKPLPVKKAGGVNCSKIWKEVIKERPLFKSTGKFTLPEKNFAKKYLRCGEAMIKLPPGTTCVTMVGGGGGEGSYVLPGKGGKK